MYTIEDNVPLSDISYARAESPITKTMRQLEVGQSFLVTDVERNKVRGLVCARNATDKPKRFRSATVAGGVRVWRVE